MSPNLMEPSVLRGDFSSLRKGFWFNHHASRRGAKNACAMATSLEKEATPHHFSDDDDTSDEDPGSSSWVYHNVLVMFRHADVNSMTTGDNAILDWNSHWILCKNVLFWWFHRYQILSQGLRSQRVIETSILFSHPRPFSLIKDLTLWESNLVTETKITKIHEAHLKTEIQNLSKTTVIISYITTCCSCSAPRLLACFPAGSVGCFRDGGGLSQRKKTLSSLQMYDPRNATPNDATHSHTSFYIIVI